MQPYPPPSNVPVAPSAAKGSGGGLGKALIGCAVGCALLALVLLVAAGVGAWWLVSPGEQHATAGVVGPGAYGAFTMGDLGADPGFTALLDHFVRELQRQQQAGMPPWMRQLQQLGSAGSPSTGFRMLLPRQATFTLEESPGEGPETAVLLALNPRGMTRLLRTLLPDRATYGEHRGQRVMRFSGDGWGALVGGTFLFATHEETLYGGIDRLLAGGDAPPPPPPDLGAPARPWDVTGTISNRDGMVVDLLLAEESTLPGVGSALVGLDLADSDLLTGRVVVECDNPAAVEEVLRALRRRAAEYADELAEDGLELRTAPRGEATRVVLDWEVHGLAGAVSRWAEEAAQNQQSGPATE